LSDPILISGTLVRKHGTYGNEKEVSPQSSMFTKYPALILTMLRRERVFIPTFSVVKETYYEALPLIRSFRIEEDQ